MFKYSISTIIRLRSVINRQSVRQSKNGFSLHEGGIIFGTVMDLRSNDAYAAYDIQIVRISLLVKGYARLSPDFSMDFVRLIYFVVFLMLDKMQKNFFGKSTFLTCVETIFRSTIFDKIFFSKLNFFVFKSFRISHWTLRGHSLVTPKVLFTYFA